MVVSFGIICKKIGREAATAVFPRVCPVCGEILVEDDCGKIGFLQAETEAHDRQSSCLAINPYICRYCYEQLKFVREPKCFKCGRQLEQEEDEFCHKCVSEWHEYEQGMSLLVHNDSARKMLYDLKYSNLFDNADFLALETALRLGKRIISLRTDAVIPVPLHKKRKRDRGFNQAEILSEKIIKDIEILSGVRLHYDNQILVRHHNTKPQKELKEEKRRINVKDSFSLTMDCCYKRVLLVDDIYTTGSTIDECARALKNGGASEVCFLTMSIV